MDLITTYFPGLSDTQKAQFEALYDLYIDWNSKINVISRKDITNLYEHHVLHSLGIAKFIRFVPETEVMDKGQVMIVAENKPVIVLELLNWIQTFSPQLEYEQMKNTPITKPLALVPASNLVVED